MSGKQDMERLTRELKETAIRQGAVLVGIASIDRFEPRPPYHDRIPRGQRPGDFLPNAKSVISLAQPLLNPAIDAPANLAEMDLEMIPADAKLGYLESFYGKVAHFNLDVSLLLIGQYLGQFLMANGYDAMIFPTEGVHVNPANGMTEREIMAGPNREWADKYSPFRYHSGPFSHRHAATRAGLGEFGYNNLVLTRKFGARQRFNSVITDAELLPDPLITEPICLRDRCRLCLKACHMDAITFRDDQAKRDYRTVEKVDKGIIFIDTPVKTDPVVCSRRMDRIPNFPLRGDCVRICPLPKFSNNLTKRLASIVEEWRRGE
jgi:epoxyqueuosine reductase